MNKTTWQRVKLGEITSIIGDGLHGTPKFDNNGEYFFINGNNLSNGRIIIKKDTKRIAKTEFLKYKKDINENTILISINGTIGNMALYRNENIMLGKSACYFNVKDRINRNFLRYVVIDKDFQEYLKISATGTTILNVPLKAIRDYEFSLPPLETQHKIAEILSSLDDKIDLLHHQNKTLESLALTLFRHTFIDNPKRNAWEEVTLNDICLKIASGGTPSTRIKEYYSGKINWYSTKELDDNFLFDSIQTITEAGLENSSAKLFPKDTIIIAIYAAPTVGRLGILTQDSAFNQAACGLIIDETKCSKEFVFCFLKNERENLNLLASGSAQQNLNVEKIKRYTLLLPDKATFHNFQFQVKGFFNKIYNNSKQIQNLESLRDIMLPKLLSGEMEV